ncbi:ATP-binding protein [Lelliottia sp. V106_12]|uniref:ATP-binding protein n=1 Tax=Lelliottia wanjuensis TaxID=3050585 RepID=A0AAP4FVZ3_9ENTR|nr:MULTISPECIES: ATP-binding protein [unclassified Lelliottia]MDK9361867.1 ATP-binding protein [Lelliottia sp. V106_12]MDK9584404.1 ATP-binding protein [Lelliottia sp. V86_10]MDK9617267.1 ATP-binding protein [Lelliottia sp. V106_9]
MAGCTGRQEVTYNLSAFSDRENRHEIPNLLSIQLCLVSLWFHSAGKLLQELRKARSLLWLNEMLLKLKRYRVIVIDDLGYVERDNAETGVLFELIAHRYERGSLIITSNLPFSTWGSIFVDETMAVAAADRLIHHGYIFEVTGESYGKKTSKAAIQQSAKK